MNMIAGNFPFQRMVLHLQIFMIWKTLFFQNYRFILFARGTLMALSTTFKNSVGTLLGTVALLEFKIFVIECNSSGSVSVKNNIFLQKIIKDACVFFIWFNTFTSCFFINCAKKLLKFLLITNESVTHLLLDSLCFLLFCLCL